MRHQRITLTFVVAGLASGCALTPTSPPPLTGPSELGLSLSVKASPDVLAQDGVSRAQVTVRALDAASRPVRGLAVSVDVEGDDVAVDSGRLSPRSVTTSHSGEAAVTYIAPRAPAGSPSVEAIIAIVFTPVGTDFANSVPRSVLVRLVPPSAIP